MIRINRGLHAQFIKKNNEKEVENRNKHILKYICFMLSYPNLQTLLYGLIYGVVTCSIDFVYFTAIILYV